jgi:hypothetical protein
MAKKKTKTVRRTGARSRDEIKRILEEALRKEFPTDTVDISDGYEENIHVLVVSRRFDKMDERTKLDLLWPVIDRTDLNDDEKSLVSLVMPASPAEIK